MRYLEKEIEELEGERMLLRYRLRDLSSLFSKESGGTFIIQSALSGPFPGTAFPGGRLRALVKGQQLRDPSERPQQGVVEGNRQA